jgi:DNA-binding CsgD family transcriptional regulator
VAEDKEDYERASELLEQSLSIWRALGSIAGPEAALVDLGRVVLAQGDSARARMLMAESRELCRGAWSTRPIVTYLEGLASVAAMSGAPTQAARLLGAAAAISESVAEPPPPGAHVTTARGVAVAQDQLGGEAFARAWAAGRALPLDQALAETEDVVARGTSHDKDTPAATLDPTPLIKQPSKSRKAAYLTTRQTAVLRLVAEGKTDRQIAEQLVLSEKTVGRHLENIFSRLGVSSRAAASVIASRHGLV